MRSIMTSTGARIAIECVLDQWTMTIDGRQIPLSLGDMRALIADLGAEFEEALARRLNGRDHHRSS